MGAAELEGGGRQGCPLPGSLAPPRGALPQGFPAHWQLQGGFGPPCSSLRCGCRTGLPKPVPVPGREHRPPHPQPVLLVPWVLSRLPGEGWGAGGTLWGEVGGGGGRHSAGAHAHAACDPRPFFINEKNVQGLNDRQEQIYSSSPEIKLK